MVTIFSKKLFLTDLLEGFVDIHCHILPEIDDGAKSVSQSIQLIKKMQDLGVQQFIATPHIMQDFYPNDDQSIGNAYQNLIAALAKTKSNDVVINPSAEYMMDSHFEKLLDNKNLFPLKENYVLVEMSYLQSPINLEAIIHNIILKGYIPVLAHPERYPFYHNKKEYYKILKQLGCLFQLNLLSLSEHYGKSIQKIALYLLEENLIDFVGSDVHNDNHIHKLSNLVLTKTQKKWVVQSIEQTKTDFLVS